MSLFRAGRILLKNPNCRDGWSMFEMQQAMGWQLMMIFAPENYNHIHKVKNQQDLREGKKDLEELYKEREEWIQEGYNTKDLDYDIEFVEKMVRGYENEVENPQVVLSSPEHEAYRKEMQAYIPTIDDPRFQKFVEIMSTIRTDIWRDANSD